MPLYFQTRLCRVPCPTIRELRRTARCSPLRYPIPSMGSFGGAAPPARQLSRAIGRSCPQPSDIRLPSSGPRHSRPSQTFAERPEATRKQLGGFAAEIANNGRWQRCAWRKAPNSRATEQPNEFAPSHLFPQCQDHACVRKSHQRDGPRAASDHCFSTAFRHLVFVRIICRGTPATDSYGTATLSSARPHSINSSARPSSGGGIVMPSALAMLRLTNQLVLGWCLDR